MAKDINIGGRLHSIATGNVIAGADEILDDNLGKKQTQINTETYSLVESVNNALDALNPDQQEALGVAAKANANEAKLGYYVCDTDTDVAAKTIVATGYVLTTGGNIRIKMTNANTADAVTLNINNTGAKALFYNGTQASSTNSWEEGEVVEVYYDGERFQSRSINSSYKGLIKQEIVQISPRHIPNYGISITDGSAVSFGQKHWISEFILLKAGQTIVLKNIATAVGYCFLGLYRSANESSFIEGVEGTGTRNVHNYSYTAQKDIYIRVGSNDNVSAEFQLQYNIVITYGSLFKTQLINAELNVSLSDYTPLSFSTRIQSRGCLYNTSGLDIIKITANDSQKTAFALLNDYPEIVNSGQVPDFYLPMLFYVPAGETICIDVTSVNYIFFSGSTDKFPNSFPSTISYKYATVNELVQEDDDAWYIDLQPTSIEVNIEGYVVSDYIDISDADKLTFKLFSSAQYASIVYDANYKPLKKFGYGSSEGWYENEVTLPYNAKYIKYRTKYIKNGAYIKIYRKNKTNAQEIENKIVDIRNIATNAGYHYLASAYGITTDNVDNTEAIQTLVNLVNFNGGGIIELGIGTFNVAGEIQWQSNVSLIGQGQNVTIIKNTSVVEGLRGTFYGDNINNVIFRDFTIDATESTSGKGMFMRYIEDGVFENLRIIGTVPTGLGIDFIDRVKIVNCNIYGCGRGRWTVIPSGVGCSGIGIGTGWAGHQENFIITNCICEGNYNNGIFVEDQSRWGQGVMSDGSGQIIANNICRNGKNCGFSIWGGKNVIFANNISYNNNGAGFEIGYYALDGKFTGNQAIGNKYGFKISSITHDTNHIVFEANEVRGNTTSGISIATNSLVNNIVIKENELYDNTTAMNISGNSTGLVIRNNDERGSTTGITIAGEHTDAVIMGNAYFTQPVISATYIGVTTFVEQFMT